MKIYKYILRMEETQLLEVPRGSKILSVAEQRNKIAIYALVDIKQKRFDYYKFFIKPTGQDVNVNDCEFLGTVKMYEGDLMFHIFYKKVIEWV